MKLLDYVAIYGLVLMPVGAIVVAEHWLFPLLGIEQYQCRNARRNDELEGARGVGSNPIGLRPVADPPFLPVAARLFCCAGVVHRMELAAA